MLIILYDIHAFYINIALKEYPYLSLYNSDKYNNEYEFKNSDLCSEYKKEYNKGKVVGWYIKDSYYIKYQFLPNEKEIKINASLKMISSVIPQVNRINLTYNWSYFYKKILDQYPNLYREYSSKNFDYYKITDKTSCESFERNYLFIMQIRLWWWKNRR